MNEIRTLLTLELRSLYGINQFLHTGDRKQKTRFRLLIGVCAVLTGMAVFYVAGLVYGLCVLGLEEIVPAYLTVLASVLILAFGFFTAGNRIFGQRGYDLLAAMPVRSGALVISRFLCMYLEDLALTALIFLPGTVTYGLCQRPGAGFYLTAAVGGVFVPAIPLVIATLLGTLVLAVSSRMKRKSLAQSIWMVALVVVILVGSFRAGELENITLEELTRLAERAAAMMGQLYPPALWLGDAISGKSLAGLGLFALASVAVTALAVVITAGCFHRILGHMGNFNARHDYQIGQMESRGLLKALWLREGKRYFASSIYVTNTIIGPIMGAIMAVALCVTGADTLQAMIPVDIPALLPFAFAAVFCTMNTTSVAISMEGRQFWGIQALPIPAKTLLDSKILWNLTLMAPFYLISLVAMAVAVKPSLPELLWLAGIPACVVLCSVVLGIAVNLKFHSFDWEKEETVVKQSLSAMLGGFAGFLIAVALGLAAYLTPAAYGGLVRGAMCLALLGVTRLLYRENNRTELSCL